MNILYFDTSKGDLNQIVETLNYLAERGMGEILALPDFTYLQRDCPKETLIWWRDKLNEIIEERTE
jgi:hypothetical protein